MNLKEQLRKQIQQNQIQPIPKWVWMLRHIVTLGLLVVVTLMGGVVCGLLIEVISRQNWRLMERITEPDVIWITILLPLIWGVLMMGTWYVLAYLWKTTPTGYRVRSGIVMGVSVVLSVVLGTVASISGIAPLIDERAIGRIPGIRSAIEQEIRIWDAPEEGRLIGVVMPSGDGEACCILVSPRAQKWQIIPPKEMRMPTHPQGYKLTGRLSHDQESFVVEEAYSWKPPRRPRDLPPRLRNHLHEKNNHDR